MRKGSKFLAILCCLLVLSPSVVWAAEKYSQEVAKAVNDFLVEDDWNFSFDKEKGVFSFNLTLDSKLKTIHYTIHVGSDSFTVYAVSPVGAEAKDKAAMAEMAEFVCRANYGLRNGNFELDFRDGEIRYKSFADCDGRLTPPKEVIQDSIYVVSSMFKRYGPGILDVIFNGVKAKDAVAKCEE